ncbi:PhnD/SsuA/transferrin family substrate-binding protein [Pacificibacter marinus]|uniref:PhnD/SsuA/transferrin family substrate-binding protein n=1 Tax=Pacificibacter marinus TaxID=658057 RepID=UPI001C0707E7|nr:PhnD/SsuA/transferrin family substrate-binding protein [Pacificibacter marinus]MBU2867457.1 PhnD/SsuA/transferrin family substrate-binding protein [Pacificibacter marinus]
MTLRLTMICTQTDRVRPILDGTIRIDGVNLDVSLGQPEEIFATALRKGTYDITELSMSSHILTTARGDSKYIAVPIFPARSFRHSSIFVNTNSGIKKPEDLSGKRIGLPDYQQTAAMWVRGILNDHYGVKPEDMRWVMGGQETPSTEERTPIVLPDKINLEKTKHTETLNNMLLSGEIDALITPRAPSSFQSHPDKIKRLFPQYRAAEAAYFKETHFFPIMHCIAIRKDIVAAHPWLPSAVFKAFDQAKEMALSDLKHTNFVRTALPWLSDHYDETKALMGDDIWPYGLEKNQEELLAMIRYANIDGQISHPVKISDLFCDSGA